LQAEALEGDDHRVRPRGPTPWLVTASLWFAVSMPVAHDAS